MVDPISATLMSVGLGAAGAAAASSMASAPSASAQPTPPKAPAPAAPAQQPVGTKPQRQQGPSFLSGASLIPAANPAMLSASPPGKTLLGS